MITNQDAKLVLSAYRPNGADAWDPFFEEALEEAKRDPELMEWFVKQGVFDDVIVSKLRTIEPPAGLILEIVAGLQAVGTPPFGLVKRGARNEDFLFKSATKLGPQMVYELNEKSTI